MTSPSSPGFYDEDTLKVIESAFRDIWDRIAPANPSQNTDVDGLRAAVIDQLLCLVGQGITDVSAMREAVLKYFTQRSST